MDNTEPNPRVGHGDQVGEARGLYRRLVDCTAEHRTCNHFSSLLIK